jgi:hypothetical protein
MATLELAAMDIDLSVLRSLESEKDISSETAIKAIEDALLMAYHKTEGANPAARVEVDRKTGHVTVWAKETAPDETPGREYDDTPAGFGRIAATTARQVILQRLRDVEDEMTFGEYAGHEGDIVAGIIQQGKDPRTVLVDLGKIEAVLPLAEQVPGERYVHGERIRCYVWRVRKGHRGPSVTLSRTHPDLVRKLFALEVPEIANGAVEIVKIAREAGHRTKIAVQSHQQGVNAKGACIGPVGSRVRNCTARRSTSWTTPTIRRISSRMPSRRPGSPASRSSTATRWRRGSRCPTTSSRWPSARKGRTRGWPPGSPAGGSTSAPTGTRRSAPRRLRSVPRRQRQRPPRRPKRSQVPLPRLVPRLWRRCRLERQ